MTTKIALIGLAGSNAGTYLESLRRMPEVLLAAVVESSSCLSADLRRAIHGVVTYPHHRNLLERFPAEGMVICDSNDSRKEAVTDCVRAGKAILCETPISETLVEAREMWAVSQAHDVLFGVCYPIRLNSAYGRVRKRILSGSLGTPLTVKVRKSEGGERVASGDSCGGESDRWTHPGTALVDSLRWLLGGEFTLVSVMGSGDEVGDRSGWLKLEVNHGSAVTVESSLMVSIGVARVPEVLCLEISGPQGCLDMELFTGVNSDAFHPGCVRSKETPIQGMLTNFVQTIRGQAQIAAEGIDGLRAIEVVEAAQRAWKFRSTEVL